MTESGAQQASTAVGLVDRIRRLRRRLRTPYELPDWRNEPLPAAATAPPTMLLRTELQLLYSLARHCFGNWGHIVDAGCFLGGSTAALAQGVLDNPRYQAAPRYDVIHAYDLFRVEPWTIGRFFPEDTEAGASTELQFRRNIAEFAQLVEVNVGDVMETGPFGRPIEILFIDIAKHWTINDHLVRNFLPFLVPGRSWVIQQDYLFHRGTGWLPVTMEYFADYFELVDHTGRNSVLFRYVKPIPEALLQQDLIAGLGLEDIRRLSRRAERRFPREQRRIIRQAGDEFLALAERMGWAP